MADVECDQDFGVTWFMIAMLKQRVKERICDWVFRLIKERSECQMLLSEGRPCFSILLYFARNPWHFLLVFSVLEPPNWVSRLKIRIDKQKKHWRVSQIILVPFDFRPRFGPRRPSLMPTIYVAYMPRRGPKLLGSSWGPFLVEWPKNPFQRILVGGKRERTVRGLIVDTGKMRRD